MFDGKELQPQHAPKAPHEDPEFLEQYTGAADPHSGRIHPSLVQLRERDRGHHRDVSVRRASNHANRAGAIPHS